MTDEAMRGIAQHFFEANGQYLVGPALIAALADLIQSQSRSAYLRGRREGMEAAAKLIDKRTGELRSSGKPDPFPDVLLDEISTSIRAKLAEEEGR